ncbi:MAG: sulfatase/phosphatase domain-containing protein, partial [Verrucomicrobiota bacterium]|nr:sulfatase/phosphatase domain-containing protein [Verrucomicrobiota bacterium]
GRSLLPELSGKKAKPRPLYWHYPHYHGSTWKPGASIRDGDWKLIKFYHPDKVELYNQAQDPSETNDWAKKNPDKVRELESKLVAWQTKMKAKLPVPNPDYAPPSSP